MKRILYPLTAFLVVFAAQDRCLALEVKTGVLRGVVSDGGDRPVESAEVYAYASGNVRRPADFISPKTDSTGVFHMTLPEGRYLVMARVRIQGGFGPLKPGDMHSGEPLEITIDHGKETVIRFIVSDITKSPRSLDSGTHVKVTGKITSTDGTPQANACAIAHSSEIVSGLPDYVSAWTAGNGVFVLYLPAGDYYVGASRTFPPPQGTRLHKTVRVNRTSATPIIDLVLEKGSVKDPVGGEGR